MILSSPTFRRDQPKLVMMCGTANEPSLRSAKRKRKQASRTPNADARFGSGSGFQLTKLFAFSNGAKAFGVREACFRFSSQSGQLADWSAVGLRWTADFLRERFDRLGQ